MVALFDGVKKVAVIIFLIIMIIVMVSLAVAGTYQLSKEWLSIFRNDNDDRDEI